MFQRPMRFVHAAFSSGLETLVEPATMIFVRRSIVLCVVDVHLRNVCDLDVVEQRR